MARVKHGHGDWMSYHVTTRTVDGRFDLARASDKWLVLSALRFYRERGDCNVYGFVIMDNHVHLIIHPREGIALSRIVGCLKTWSSRGNSAKRGNHLWERRYDDNCIRSTEELNSVLEYIHNNPVRAGIVADPREYPWSSVHSYLRDGRELIGIDSDWWSW